MFQGEASDSSPKRGLLKYFFLLTIACLHILIAMQYLPYSTNSVKSNSFGLLASPDFKISAQNQHLSQTDRLGKISPNNSHNKGIEDHPYLSQRCFVYRNFTAKFNCTQSPPYMKYTKELITKCASKSWELFKDKKAPDPWHSSSMPTSVNSSAIYERPAIHWVMVGDSHIRNIFDVLLRRIATARLKYRLSSFEKNDWRNARLLLLNRRATMHQPLHEVIHFDVPLKVIYHWDPMLEKLPKLLKQWETGNSNTRPTHLLVGATLHFMKNTTEIYLTEGPEKASELFAKQVRIIAPLLMTFSKTTPTIYKLQDHLQEHPKNNIANWNNINLYNQIVVDEITENKNLSVWRSSIPLSDQYAEECKLRFKRTPETDEWKCHDRKHVGYIMIEQYVDMYLNDMCNGVV